MTRALDISPVILHLQKPRTKDNILYSFALHAWKDKERRYGWHAIEAELTDVPVDKKEITTLLERCWAKLKSVSESDLK